MLRSIKYGVNAAVLAGIVAAPVFWASVDKTVHLSVDGRAETVHTSATRVGDVLSANGYRVSAHDLVVPSPSARVTDGADIVLRRGRLLRLSVDGVRTSLWTTARTVSEALGDLGYPAGDFVSVSRSRRLPLQPTSIAIRSQRLVRVVHDGRTDEVTTTDPTVGQVLSDLGITLDRDDRLSVPPSTAVQGGQVIRVQRVLTETVTRTRTIAHGTTRQRDNTLRKGTTEIVHQGRDGTVRATYALVYVDGTMTARTKLRELTTRAPLARVIRIGTKIPEPVVAAPAPRTRTSHTSSSGNGTSGNGTPSNGTSARTVAAPTPGSAQAIARSLLAARGWGDNQFSCLVAMWNRESGWQVHAANSSGAYGIPQALPGAKMASAGPDWQNSAETQIRWGLQYITSRYHDPCNAWSIWQSQGWY